ncbi:hypothetical protein Q4519_06660 [Motilimonas sp. 1_MG-2023]|uniref:hypothetical protein n=1 Tax=Motilimonas sp. 1_MG-2023 TaxID=3062672 RepID=UPI0026E300E4|nr:hypothetical protein [Motilimonas sp. 1_MG-2023]MDO6525364.1 hypothetical protein [Motilimonas sp. 1_MG-2023]
MFKKTLVLSLGLLVSSLANANVDETCAEAGARLNKVIDDWNTSVLDYSTPEKNPSVIAMYKDYKDGTLEDNFVAQCKEKWAMNQDIFECFSGVRSEMGASMCRAPETNANDWKY